LRSFPLLIHVFFLLVELIIVGATPRRLLVLEVFPFLLILIPSRRSLHDHVTLIHLESSQAQLVLRLVQRAFSSFWLCFQRESNHILSLSDCQIERLDLQTMIALQNNRLIGHGMWFLQLE